MGRKRLGYKIVIGTMLLSHVLCGPAMASTQPLTLHATYRVAWNEITIGKIQLDIEETGNRYHARVETRTHGIAALFSDEKRIAESWGTRTNDRYTPTRYQAIPADEGAEGRRVTLRYDHGKLMERSRIPDDDPSWRPPVPVNLANSATDPVTAGLMLRAWLVAGQTTPRDLRTYDAARLAVMHLAPQPALETREISGESKQVRPIRLVREPIAGYTPKELKTFAKGDPAITLYFTTDAGIIPVAVEIDTSFGVVMATLTSQE